MFASFPLIQCENLFAVAGRDHCGNCDAGGLPEGRKDE
jgi:hypothetical protein